MANVIPPFLLVDGVKYDATQLIKTHPGGSEVLMHAAEMSRHGFDCGALIRQYHCTAMWDCVLARIRTFDKVESSHPVSRYWKTSPAQYEYASYKAIKSEIEKTVPRSPTWSLYVTVVIQLAIYVVLVVAVVHGWRWPALWASLLGMFEFGIGFNVLHDASHYSLFTSSPCWNEIASDVTNAFLLWHGRMWHNHHVHLHHSFTGDPYQDPDALLFDKFGLNRKAGSFGFDACVDWLKPIVLYAIQSLDYHFLHVGQNRVPVQMRFSTWYEWGAVFVKCCLLYQLGTYAVVYLVSMSFFYYVNIVGDHDQAFIIDRNYSGADWKTRQVRNSGDFLTAYPLWSSFFGGINHQTAHHLFPNWSGSRLPEVTAWLKRKYGNDFIAESEGFSDYVRQILSRKTIQDQEKIEL